MVELTKNEKRLLEEARERAKSVLDTLTFDELVDFSGYVDAVRNAYQGQESRWLQRDSTEDVPFPRYRKIRGLEFEEKDWWTRIQKLFSEDDGNAMNGLVFKAVEGIIRAKARDNSFI